jgi:hypothetical protein
MVLTLVPDDQSDLFYKIIFQINFKENHNSKHVLQRE